jgi:hypothetical protein
MDFAKFAADGFLRRGNFLSWIFIEHFPSGGFDNTSPNITSTLPLMPISDVLAGVLVVYGRLSAS